MLKLNAFQLKWVAIIAMALNHVVIAWWEIIPFGLAIPFYAVGGLTFPIMAFFVVEGYKHTRNLKRYILRVLIIGVIAAPFHFLTLGQALGPNLNIMFTIALSLLVLLMYDKIKAKALFWVLYLLIIVPVSLFLFEWSFPGVTMVLLFYIIQDEKARRIIPPICAVAYQFVLSIFIAIPVAIMKAMETGADTAALFEMDGLAGDPQFVTVSATFILGMLFSSVLLARFNGERGKPMKWLFYIFYPAHFAVLAVVAVALGFVDLSNLTLWPW
ncbi:MAG: conjugal transfer protein TraX [Defluviitaleaceae bacterium]|nr:conjugal transfer protein TraX [Defluviitaleaceae bacterium]